MNRTVSKRGCEILSNNTQVAQFRLTAKNYYSTSSTNECVGMCSVVTWNEMKKKYVCLFFFPNVLLELEWEDKKWEKEFQSIFCFCVIYECKLGNGGFIDLLV